jgi:hypothetical protein
MNATWRLIFTALVMFIALTMLAWEHFNGGVKTHHIMQSAAMPGISNWWNLLLLPALAWFLSGRIQRRITLHHATQTSDTAKFPKHIVVGFVGAMLLGSLLSLFFALGKEDITTVLFFGMLLTALVLPVYRAECVLGFVLGMTFIFGAFIPIVIGSIIAAIAAILQCLIYPLVARAWRRMSIR